MQFYTYLGLQILCMCVHTWACVYSFSPVVIQNGENTLQEPNFAPLPSPTPLLEDV